MHTVTLFDQSMERYWFMREHPAEHQLDYSATDWELVKEMLFERLLYTDTH